MDLAWIIAACFTGGFVQGASGFGLGLVILALLGLLMPVREAAVFSVLAALCVNFFMLVRLRSYFSFRGIKFTMPAMLVGVPFGVFFLVRIDAFVLQVVLVIILLSAGLQTLLRDRLGRRLKRPWHPVFLGVPCGLLSGGLSGAYGTGGPPLLGYVLSQGFDRRHYAAALQSLFFISGCVRLFEMLRHGLILPRMLPLLSGTAIAAVIGASIGLVLLHRIPEKKFFRAVALIMIALAGRYFWMAVNSLV